MATLKEILAAKAKEQGSPAPKAGLVPAAEFVEQEANKRGETTGMIIKAEDEKKKLAASIKETMDGLAPKIQPPTPEPRELGATEKGERLPFQYPENPSDPDDREWFASMHAFESDLVIVLDPDSKHAWIAVKRNKHHPFPLLLHKLPLHLLPSQPF